MVFHWYYVYAACAALSVTALYVAATTRTINVSAMWRSSLDKEPVGFGLGVLIMLGLLVLSVMALINQKLAHDLVGTAMTTLYRVVTRLGLLHDTRHQFILRVAGLAFLLTSISMLHQAVTQKRMSALWVVEAREVIAFPVFALGFLLMGVYGAILMVHPDFDPNAAFRALMHW